MSACLHDKTIHCGCDDGRNCPLKPAERSATLADLDAVIARWQGLHDTADDFSDDPDMDRSEFAITLRHLRDYRTLLTTPSVPAQGEAMENDCEEQGFTTYDYGCNVCPNKGWAEDGKPIRYAIVQRGHLMCCERCGGSYGMVPATAGDSR